MTTDCSASAMVIAEDGSVDASARACRTRSGSTPWGATIAGSWVGSDAATAAEAAEGRLSEAEAARAAAQETEGEARAAMSDAEGEVSLTLQDVLRGATREVAVEEGISGLE